MPNPKGESTALALRFDLPDRIEHLDCPDIYADHWVDLVTNQPDADVIGRTVIEGLAAAIHAWSFKLTDGQAAPHTPEAILAMPPDLHMWLINEYQERRLRPLAARLSSLPPHTISNGHSPEPAAAS